MVIETIKKTVKKPVKIEKFTANPFLQNQFCFFTVILKTVALKTFNLGSVCISVSFKHSFRIFQQIFNVKELIYSN